MKPSPSLVPIETAKFLCTEASALLDLAPWEFTEESDLVGLPVTGSDAVRICTMLGGAGEVFGPVIYRNTTGLRSILSLLTNEDEDGSDPEESIDGMDCLKIEFVAKRELSKPEAELLRKAGYAPKGKGLVYPSFTSCEPGVLPSPANADEISEIAHHLPLINAFFRLLEARPDLYGERAITDIPMVRRLPSGRPLAPKDLEWIPMLVPPPARFDASGLPPDQMARLGLLPLDASFTCEFDCATLPGSVVTEGGKDLMFRTSMLVDASTGLAFSSKIHLAPLGLVPSATAGLLAGILKAGRRPGLITIRSAAIHSAIAPVFESHGLRFRKASALPRLDEAFNSLTEHLLKR